MEDVNIFEDISSRTGGNIYISAVGPVRTGKSTFIKKFMDLVVLPVLPMSMTVPAQPIRCRKAGQVKPL